ncbi:hypothetical protein TWF481_005136 [Arthrobotrys musiformis]|uniref:Uncharacterized protein n=1 Tax=Arthrobotrys musiformis TaxID=47236 RepID=A0AAV9WEK0_9PEZI
MLIRIPAALTFPSGTIISPRSTDNTDQNVAMVLGVIFGVVGFIILLCLFTCCCGACRLRTIPIDGEDVEKSSSDGCCDGGGGGVCRSPRQKGQAWRRVETREEVKERVVGGRGAGGVSRPGMARLGNPRPLQDHYHHRSLPRLRPDLPHPREVRGLSPAPPVHVGNGVPDLRFPISEGSSSDSESINIGTPSVMPMRAPSPPRPLRAPIRPPVSLLPRVIPPRTIIQPVAVHPRNAVTRPEFEDAIDDVETLVGARIEGAKAKIESELEEERRQRRLEIFESNAVQEEILNELEERRKRDLEALGSNVRHRVMEEDIEELKERTTNLEYENQRTKDTLISIANRPKTPPPPVVINNTCRPLHRSNSRKFEHIDDTTSSDSGFGGTMRPMGPGPPPPAPPPSPGFSPSLGDDFLTGSGPARFESPPSSPSSLSQPFRPPRSPFNGPGMLFPEGSLDEGSGGFQTAASSQPSPRTTPRPPPPSRRPSIEYPMPPQQEAPIPPNSRPPPLHPRPTPGQAFRRPPLRTIFLGAGEDYYPPSSMDRSISGGPPSPKFRGMPPMRRFPNTPGGISGGRRSSEDIRAPPASRHTLPPESINRGRRRSRDQDPRRGRMRRGSDPLGGPPQAGFTNLRGRNASIVSNHVAFAPSDEFELYSAQSHGFDDGSSIAAGIPAPLIPPNMMPTFQPQLRQTNWSGRRNSFHGAVHERMAYPGSQPARSDLNLQSDTMSEDSYSTDRIRGTARRTSSTVAEPWVDGERERHLRNLQRVAGGMETIPSQDTSMSETNNINVGRERVGSGGSGVDRDGRFRYDRYSEYGPM